MKRLLFLIVLFITTHANAAIRYVDNTQSCPGSGTTGAPWCSITQAGSSISGGDILNIRQGTGVYSETATFNSKSGTLGNPTTIQYDTGASPIIRNSANGSAVGALTISESDYVTVRGLIFDANGVTPGLYAINITCGTKDCTGISVLNNQIKNWRQSLSKLDWGSNSINISGSDVSLGAGANHWVTAAVDGNILTSNDDDGIHLLRNLNSTITNNTITDQRCGADDNGNDVRAVGIFFTYENTGLTISGNSIHDFPGYTGCTRTLPSSPTVAAMWCDVGGHTTTIKNNTIFNIDQNGSASDTSKFAMGLFIEAGCDGFTVEQNVIYNVKNAGIVNSYHPNNALTAPVNNYFNNTIYHTGWAMFLKEGRPVMKNNIYSTSSQAHICYGCGSGSPSSLSVAGTDYNLYNVGSTTVAYSGIGNLNFSQWKTQCGCDSHGLNLDPLFVSIVTPDFHLQSSSPAINTGTDVGLPFTGSAPDMGAFESGSAASGVISWANSRTSGTGTGVGTANWTISNIPLLSGLNPITVTATDNSGNAGMSGIGVTYAPTFPGNTAVALYGLETGSGTSAVDSSGNSNTGTLINGVAWTTTGKYGNAVSLNGTNQYLQATDSISFGVTQSFGVSAWVNPSSVHTDFRSILEKDSQTLPNPPIAFYASVGPWPGCSPGVPAIYLNVNGALGPLTWVCAASPLPTNTWSHVAATYDFATLKLFVNGSLVASSTATGYIEPGTGTVYVGASQYGEYFQGSLDEVRFYNWGIPLTAGSNTSPGAACVFGNPLDPLQQSVVRDMNCPVIQTTPPLAFKLPASATGLKLQGTLKLGNQ